MEHAPMADRDGTAQHDDVAGLDDAALAARIERLVLESARRRHAGSLPAENVDRQAFDPEVDSVPYAGRVFGPEEVAAASRSVLDFWLTLGAEGEQFERELARMLGVRRSILTNSGSSANLLAISALTSPLVGERRLRPGDEVITCASGFPTTVAPIVQAGAVPVLLDADPLTGNMRTDLLEEALTPRTRGVMIAHALGSAFDLARIVAFCRENGLWLIEDNCDALGSTYTVPNDVATELNVRPIGVQNGSGVTRPTGTWGDLSTQSFYPPHHITLGEGGAVNIVRSISLRRPIESLRDWGRDCWCPSGEDDTCGKRFEWQLGGLPEGYDHKYTYSHLGYNLKPLDVQAAIGRVQLGRLDAFSAARRANWQRLRAGLDDLQDRFTFALPTHATGWRAAGPHGGQFRWDASGYRSDPSWFGFMLLVDDDAPFSASDLSRHLDRHRIGNRRLFGGNLVRQPAFVQLAQDRPDAFRVVGGLDGADAIMRRAVFIGTYPGLTPTMLERMIDVLHDLPKA
jgi:CDP-6-deoxy-D-xylo-4-hexulose-3-dehydrase